jgi:hypothetical protein
VHHGRDQWQKITIAADADGRIRGLDVDLLADMGAYLMLVTPGVPLLGAFMFPAIYKMDAYSFKCTGVFTTKMPTDAYRGAGRPEATFAIERRCRPRAQVQRISRGGKDRAHEHGICARPGLGSGTSRRRRGRQPGCAPRCGRTRGRGHESACRPARGAGLPAAPRRGPDREGAGRSRGNLSLDHGCRRAR